VERCAGVPAYRRVGVMQNGRPRPFSVSVSGQCQCSRLRTLSFPLKASSKSIRNLKFPRGRARTPVLQTGKTNPGRRAPESRAISLRPIRIWIFLRVLCVSVVNPLRDLWPPAPSFHSRGPPFQSSHLPNLPIFHSSLIPFTLLRWREGKYPAMSCLRL
jgi:hypothetical protein